jgi:hypothetical protein
MVIWFFFFFLLLAPWNNVYYKYESLFLISLLIGIGRYCHNKKYLIFFLWRAKMDSVVCNCLVDVNSMCVALNPTQFTTSKQNFSIFHLECVEGNVCLWLSFKGYCFVRKGACASGFPLKAIFLYEFSGFKIACRAPRKISLWWFKFCGIRTLCQYETHTHWSFLLHQGSKQHFLIISFGSTSLVPSTPPLSNLIYKFTTSVCDGARVRHRRPTGPGPALPDSRISTVQGLKTQVKTESTYL